MIEYTFSLTGTHRQTTVCREDILSAARDAASLLEVAPHEVLLWLPPLPPLTSGTARRNAPAPVETVEPKGSGSEETTTTTMTLDLVSIGRACFPIFLARAEHHWHTWQQHQGTNREARLRYTLMVCGAIDAIPSVDALEQVRSHLLVTSGMPAEMMAPAFEVALQELVSLQAIFCAPYERLAYHLCLCVLTFACLAVPLEQVALDRLRDALTSIERQCSMQVREIEAEEED